MRPEIRRERRRKSRQREAKRRVRDRRVWLTDLHRVEHEVQRAISRTEMKYKPGLVLTGVLAHLDENNHLWVLRPGYAWDGASYPDPETAPTWFRRMIGRFLRFWVGDRNLAAIEASSAFHDDMDESSEVYLVNEEHRELLPEIFRADHPWPLIEQIISEAQKIPHPMTIWKAAYRYTAMIAAWPGETIGWLRRNRQRIGLILAQPWYRLALDSGNSRWAISTREQS